MSIKPKAFVGVTKTKWWTNKKILTTLAVCLLLAATVGLYLTFKPGSDKQNASNPACTTEVVDKAAKVLAPSEKNNAKLQKIAEKIEKTPGFDKDVNCLHIVLSYYINIGWAEKAKEYLTKLEGIYEQSNGFSVRLGSDAKTIEQFRKDISFLEKVAKEMEKNSIRTSTPKEVENKTYEIKPPKGVEKPKNYSE